MFSVIQYLVDLVMGNLGRVLKTLVLGFDFKKPGSGFPNTKFEFFVCTELFLHVLTELA